MKFHKGSKNEKNEGVAEVEVVEVMVEWGGPARDEDLFWPQLFCSTHGGKAVKTTLTFKKKSLRNSFLSLFLSFFISLRLFSLLFHPLALDGRAQLRGFAEWPLSCFSAQGC